MTKLQIDLVELKNLKLGRLQIDAMYCEISTMAGNSKIPNSKYKTSLEQVKDGRVSYNQSFCTESEMGCKIYVELFTDRLESLGKASLSVQDALVSNKADVALPLSNGVAEIFLHLTHTVSTPELKKHSNEEDEGDNGYVNLNFTIPYKTVFGESLYIIGSIPQLGDWKASHETKMVMSDDYVWQFSVSVSKKQIPFEYKYLVHDFNNRSSKWESTPNRQMIENKNGDVNDKWEILHDT